MLTGRGTTAQAVEAMKLGAPDFMEKPVEIQALVAKIEEAASRKSQLHEKRLGNRMKDILRKKGR